MKRVLLAIGAGLFPYAVLVAVKLMNSAAQEGHIVIIPIAFALGLACAIALLVLSCREKWFASNMALCSMILKLVQIPAYILFFMVGMSGVIFVQFLAVTFIIWLIDVLTITLSGIVGISAVLRCRAEGKLTRSQTIIHGILQFIFCADVISAIIVYRKSKEGSL